MHCITCALWHYFMHFRCVFTLLKWLCASRIRLGWAYVVFTITYPMLMHFHAYVPYILYILIYWLYLVLFYVFLSLPLSLLFMLVVSWHLSVNLLHPKTLFVPGHPLLLTLLPPLFGSVMTKLNRTFRRTFLDEAFIRNAWSFCRTSLTLTYPLSFIIRVGSHCMASRSLDHLYWYRSSTSTCMDLIIQYLFLLLAFEVHALCSLRILYPRCSVSRG